MSLDPPPPPCQQAGYTGCSRNAHGFPPAPPHITSLVSVSHDTILTQCSCPRGLSWALGTAIQPQALFSAPLLSQHSPQQLCLLPSPPSAEGQCPAQRRKPGGPVPKTPHWGRVKVEMRVGRSEVRLLKVGPANAGGRGHDVAAQESPEFSQRALSFFLQLPSAFGLAPKGAKAGMRLLIPSGAPC